MAYNRLALQPTTIHLEELPNEGRTFVYTNESGELTPFLKDLLGQRPYRVEIEVKPMGNVYSATGFIEAGLEELCSRCAIDFILPVKERFNEILVVGETPLEGGGHQARVNHSSELNAEGPECTELPSPDFKVADFVHELIALARPIKPMAKADCDDSCENYQTALQKGWITTGNSESFQKTSPFSELSKLKLNS